MEEQKAYEIATRKAPDLSLDIIKKYICPKATDLEAYTFMQLCRAQGLNPFLREAYLIKYGDEAATIITGKDTFTKRADRLPQYDGFKAGIIVLSQGQIVHREGSLFVSGETLIGGWAEVFRKDRGQSFRNEVSISEYERKKKDGSLMSNWKLMPATMIRKVALVQSLREAFPDEFGGMYSPEEMPIDAAALPTYDYGNHPVYPKPQEDKPPLKEPGKKDNGKPTEKPALTALVGIKEITHKNGKKRDGTAYCMFIIIDENDVKYATFSETLTDIATSALTNKQPVKIAYEEGAYGNKITSLEIAESVLEIADN